MKTLLEQFEFIADNIGEYDKFNSIGLNECSFPDANHIFFE
ncbi:hypothetical protein [Cysteiniphilum marinum]|nr:hypothetical protein [Cysteiniphilum marinum]